MVDQDAETRARVAQICPGGRPELIWRNEVGGTTWRAGELFVKWNHVDSGIDLARELKRLEWLAGRHPVPAVVDFDGCDGTQWLVTKAMPGESAVTPRWQARPDEAVRAIAEGLRHLHRVDCSDFPIEWSNESWVGRDVPGLPLRPAPSPEVLVHGDACSPNTIISPGGRWIGNVDFVDLAVGDRWADLAVASMALEWNYGQGFEQAFYKAYGIEPDADRIAYYRQLWKLES